MVTPLSNETAVTRPAIGNETELLNINLSFTRPDLGSITLSRATLSSSMVMSPVRTSQAGVSGSSPTQTQRSLSGWRDCAGR